RHIDPLDRDVLPDIELGPVGQREDPDVLTRPVPPVVEVPQLGPLVLGVPLPEIVAEAEHPLLGPSLLLVAAATTKHRVDPVLLDRLQQRHRLKTITTSTGPLLLDDLAGIDGVLDMRHHQPHPQLGHPPLPELTHLTEVVPSITL